MAIPRFPGGQSNNSKPTPKKPVKPSSSLPDPLSLPSLPDITNNYTTDDDSEEQWDNHTTPTDSVSNLTDEDYDNDEDYDDDEEEQWVDFVSEPENTDNSNEDDWGEIDTAPEPFSDAYKNPIENAEGLSILENLDKYDNHDNDSKEYIDEYKLAELLKNIEGEDEGDNEDEDEDEDGYWSDFPSSPADAHDVETEPDVEEDEDEDEESWQWENVDDETDSLDNEEIEPEPEFEPEPEPEIEPEPEPEPKPSKPNREEPKQNNNTSKPPKKKGGLLGKLAEIKQQIKDEASGTQTPQKQPQTNNPWLDTDDEAENDYDNEEEAAPKRTKGSNKNSKSSGIKLPKFLQQIFGILGNLYKKIVQIFFKILTTILKILSSIPLIGRLIKPLLQLTKPLEKIASGLPVLLLIVLIIFGNIHAAPLKVSTSLPDDGSASFSKFKYDKSTGAVSGTVTNTGQIIAKVSTSFKVYSLQPSINPLSWFIPKQVAECEGETVSVDVDSDATVNGNCGEVSGLFPRAGGVIDE